MKKNKFKKLMNVLKALKKVDSRVNEKEFFENMI
jgi:hypothetical protein